MTQSSNRRVLAVGAHPDDVEITCGGLLALLVAEGFEAHVATLSLGDCGWRSCRLPEIASVRRKEAERACAVTSALTIVLPVPPFRDFQRR